VESALCLRANDTKVVIGHSCHPAALVRSQIIQRLGSEPPSATELKGIQNYLSGVFILRNSTRGNLIGQLQFVDEQGLGEDYLTKYVARVNAVTPEEVKKLTAKYLKPEAMTVVVVGDKAQISEQLTAFAPVAKP
jgi:zinc protease